MRNRPNDNNQATGIDPLQERTQRDQEERSQQALSNQGAQDRKPTVTHPDRDPRREHRARER